MPHICVDTPIPSFDGIMASFRPLLTFPPALPNLQLPHFEIPKFPGMPNIQWPALPAIPKLPDFTLALLGLPNPLLGSLRMPNLEFVTIAIQLQSFQFQTTLMAMIKPMLSFLGMDIASFLPKLPGLPNFDLVDLVSGNVTALVAAVKQAILDKVQLPFVPIPLFGTLKIPDLEITHTLMALVSGYLQTVTTAVIGLIKKVTDKLKIAAMPALPSFPSFDSVVNMVKSAVRNAIAGIQLPNLSLEIPKFPGWPNIEWPSLPAIPGMLQLPSINLPAILASITFPGFPPLPAIPDPLVPNMNFPDVNIAMGIKLIMHNLTLGLLKPIMDFIENTLKKFISFTFPKICIDL